MNLNRLLLTDSFVVGATGVALALSPSSWYADSSLIRGAGAALALSAVEVGLASRWHGQRLRLAAAVTAGLAFTWTLGMAVAAEATHVTGPGRELMALSGLATMVFGTLEVRAVTTAVHPDVAGRTRVRHG